MSWMSECPAQNVCWMSWMSRMSQWMSLDVLDVQNNVHIYPSSFSISYGVGVDSKLKLSKSGNYQIEASGTKFDQNSRLYA